MFYDNIRKLYAAADAETRRVSREHWEDCHRKNAGRNGLLMFSGRILGIFAGIEASERRETAR